MLSEPTCVWWDGAVLLASLVRVHRAGSDGGQQWHWQVRERWKVLVLKCTAKLQGFSCMNMFSCQVFPMNILQ